MNIELVILRVNDRELKVYDNSIANELPLYLNSVTLQIYSSKLAGVISLDCLAYLTTIRQNNELFTIKSEHLGLGVNNIIPDGIYTFKYSINNVYQCEERIIISNFIQGKLRSLLELVTKDIKVDMTGVKYLGSYVKEYNALSIASMLYLYLSIIMDDVTKEREANDIIDKLQRLLLI